MSIATSASSDNSKVNFVFFMNGLGKLKTLYNRRFSLSLGINRISCSDMPNLCFSWIGKGNSRVRPSHHRDRPRCAYFRHTDSDDADIGAHDFY